MAFYISGDLHDSYEAAYLRPAHARCNIMRGDKDPDAYRQRLRKQGGL